MKESEFIELINLYVDHEISAADSARLEAEVAGNPARRKTYREYCMMHKACDVLAVQYRDDEAAAPRFVTEPVTRSSWGWGAGLLTGGVLAAACLALVFVVHVRQASNFNQTPVAQAAAAPAAVADFPATYTRALPAHFAMGDLQPVLNTRDWTKAAPEPTESLAWMDKVELAPIQRTSLEQLPMFKAEPMLLNTGAPATQVIAPTQDDEQMERAAFQFQR